jgi:hypothetical protein
VIGIGPEQSGTAHLMRQLFEDQDLRSFEVRLVNQPLDKQAELDAQGELDVAALVMRDDTEFLRQLIRRHGLESAAPRELEALVARHPWLSLGRIPAGKANDADVYNCGRGAGLDDRSSGRRATTCAHGPVPSARHGSLSPRARGQIGASPRVDRSLM